MLLLLMLHNVTSAAEVLPSWNNNANKQKIISFVKGVTNPKSTHFVPDEERIAVFDNDGTLWVEKPIYTQLFFAIDRVKALAPNHPAWKTKEPYSSLLKGNAQGVLAGGEPAVFKIIMASHAGMSTDQFEQIVKKWIATAKHPVSKKPYTKMVYQPMLELINYLKDNQFKIYIVSGGGVEFIRPWANKVYGIPPEHIIGSSIKTQYKMIEGKPVLLRLDKVNFINDKSGKPIGINQVIGRKPIAAFGNSDGDKEMLEWTEAPNGLRLMMLVHHDDDKREWAYGPNSKIGTFSKSLMNEAQKKGWGVISIKNDWKVVFPFQKNKKNSHTAADIHPVIK